MTSQLSLQDKTVCLIDAYGLIYQVFYAPGMEMTNSFGEPTGAVFGFVRDVLGIMTKLRPDYLLCAYDMHAPTFRHELYSEYKANRSATPDDLLMQFDFTREFLKGVGIPAIGVQGFEADDVMATVADVVEKAGGKTTLVTADKDARQLIDDSTQIYLVRKDKYYRAEDLLADWGIRPDQVVDFQALVGDSADNVPGVPLIGPKVASELLANSGNLEGIFRDAVGRKGKRFENIRNGRDVALLSRQLVTLRKDAPVDIDWDAAKLGGIDVERLTRLFRYWNFRSMMNKIEPLAAEFGTGTAEPSELFDKIDEKLNQLRAPEAAPASLFQTETRSDSAPAPDQTTVSASENPEIDPALQLMARFRLPLYGATPKADDAAEFANPDFSCFEISGAAKFPALDAIPLPPLAPYNPEAMLSEIVDTPEKLDALKTRLADVKALSIAVVTLEEPEIGRVRPRFATPCGLALAAERETAYYIPFRAPLGSDALDKNAVFDALRDLLESPDVAKIGFELKYDAIVLRDAGIKLRGIAFDAALVDYLERSGETRRGLAELAAETFEAQLFDLKAATGTGQKRVSLDRLPPETVARYARDLVLVPLCAAPVLRARMKETPALEKIATELETPLAEILAEMEMNGIAIRPDVFRNASADMLRRQEELEQEIRAAVADADPDPSFARAVNLNSTKQLQRLLFEDLKLRVVKKTKTGPSVDAEVLEELVSEHPVPAKIVELRKLVKLRGTYLEPLPSQTLGSTNRIFATFNQTATATGRLSASDPNLQNIPARSETGKLIRAGFAPDVAAGYDAFVSCDYSQIELRALAHFSGDEHLRRAFEENRDIHASVAAQIFGVSQEDVTDDMRRKAKAVNFGLIYGQTSFGLSKSIGVSTGEAADYIDRFFATYPGVLEFFDRTLDECARTGYVQTLLGRRRALSGVRGARGRKTLNFPERAAINAVVQGTAAELMKLAMLAVWRRLRKDGWISSHWSEGAVLPTAVVATPVRATQEPAGSLLAFATEETVVPEPAAPSNESVGRRDRARLLLQIHDELLFETTSADAEELGRIVAEEMALGQPLSAPLKTDVAIGKNWGEL